MFGVYGKSSGALPTLGNVRQISLLDIVIQYYVQYYEIGLLHIKEEIYREKKPNLLYNTVELELSNLLLKQ